MNYDSHSLHFGLIDSPSIFFGQASLTDSRDEPLIGFLPSRLAHLIPYRYRQRELGKLNH